MSSAMPVSVGISESRVTTKALDRPEVLPATSVAVAVKPFCPSSKVTGALNVPTPEATTVVRVEPPRRTATVLSDSAAPSRFWLAWLVSRSLLEAPSSWLIEE